MLSRDLVILLLSELDEWMLFRGTGPVDWVVCGGSALLLQHLNSRPTTDIDVLGEWNADLCEVAFIEQLPTDVQACIREVMDRHPELQGMRKGWVNPGPSRITQFGLPDGYQDRMTVLRIGQQITLRLLHRADLICLKLYAAADRHSPRQRVHLDDLKKLRPTFDEADSALEWVRRTPEFDRSRPEIQAVLHAIGHGDLDYYV